MFIRSRTDFFINLVYCIGVFWKASIIRPNGPACCIDILSGLEDCCAASVNSVKSLKAFASASFLDCPSDKYLFTLFLYIAAPPIEIAKLSAICVGKNPFLSIAASAALILLLLFAVALAISSAFTSVFKPDLLDFKKSELYKNAKSAQNCF